ncbi:MAG: FlgD immunoglobulin-like domain containing protein [Candidatus Zixiibacteriota bacterium]
MTRIEGILVAVIVVCAICLFVADARGDEFLIDSKIIYGQAEGNQTNPKAAYGTSYLVVWEDKRGVDYDVYGSRVDLFGDLVDSAGIPIATGLGHQDHPAAASDGSDYLVVWRENSDLYGVRVTSTGIVLTPEPFILSGATGDQSRSAICFGDTSYLVVWQDNRDGGVYDIYGARVKQDGTVLDPNGIAISTATGIQTFPSVAFDGTNFLVVWEDDRNGVSNFDVYGTRVTQDGSILEPLGFQIAHDESYNEQRPSVAYNSYLTGYYLVAWEDYRGPTVDIYGTRVFHDGTVIDDPVNIAISTASNAQETPSVCSRGNDFFVVWKDHRGGLYSQTVYGARVDYYGNVTDPSGIALSYSFEFYYPATVIYGTGEYLLVHAYADGTQYDIFARFVDINGNITGSVDLARSASSQTYADIAFDGTTYLVVWQSWRHYEYDIYGARVDEGGSLHDTVIAICTETDHQYHPQVAFDGTNYFAVWEHRDVDTSRIYGSRVSQAGDILDPGGFAISSSQHYQRNPTVAFDGTNYLVVWDHQGNIHGTRVNTSGTPIDVSPSWITSDYNSQKPSIVFGDPYYLVVWEQGMGLPFSDIYGKRVSPDGESEPIAIPIATTHDDRNPSVTFDGTNYLVVWENIGIHGAQVDTSGTVLGSKGIPICICSEPDADNADVVFDGTNCLVVWQEPTESFFDVCGASVSTSGEKVDSFEISTQSENQIQPALAKGSEGKTLIVYSSFTDSISGRAANAMRIWGKFYQFTDVEDESDPASPIAQFRLMQNYPNPFNANTCIQYTLARDIEVELAVYNLLGQLVRRIFTGEQQRGTHILSWDGKDNKGNDVGSGIYLYRLKTADGTQETRKMLFLK